MVISRIPALAVTARVSKRSLTSLLRCRKNSPLRTPATAATPTWFSQRQQRTVVRSTNAVSSSLSFSSTASSGEDVTAVAEPPTPKHIQEALDAILLLDVVQIHLLQELIKEKLGISREDSDMTLMAMGGGGGGGGGASGTAAAAAPAEEKTTFSVKITGFDAKSKIKVIKEVRAITGLGLKEAKEMVESAPNAVLKKDTKKEEAEEWKTKLEAVGATVDIE